MLWGNFLPASPSPFLLSCSEVQCRIEVLNRSVLSHSPLSVGQQVAIWALMTCLALGYDKNQTDVQVAGKVKRMCTKMFTGVPG